MNFPYIQNLTNKQLTYSRLNADDIMRKPDLNITRIDYYQGNTIKKQIKNKSYLKKICTAATFALTGLYIAHRNNLFNPVKREALKIVRNNDLHDKVKNFLNGKINNDTYTEMTRKFLNNLITDEKAKSEIKQQANKVLNDKNLFDGLSETINKVLNDDTTPNGLQNGYTVDILDRLKIKLEDMLNKNKNNGLPYKNQEMSFISELFKNSESKNSIVDNIFYETVSNRSKNRIHEYLQDLISNEKLASF